MHIIMREVERGSLQGTEPPVRGRRPETDQRLVAGIQLVCVCERERRIRHLLDSSRWPG
jgi:hypothetical protein